MPEPYDFDGWPKNANELTVWLAGWWSRVTWLLVGDDRTACRMCGPNWSAPLCPHCRAVMARWVREYQESQS
jgi:hypothetical protein